MRRLGPLLAAILVAGALPVGAGPSPRITHVVVIGMDNYHLEDIQAHMPALSQFLHSGAVGAGTHHPDLPTKTAPDFSSIASGQYPDRHGAINNTYLTPGSPPEFRVGFAYWENLTGVSPEPFLSEPPWLAFNRAGWDVGAVGFEGLVLEQPAEIVAHLTRLGRPPPTPLPDATRDRFWGIAVHRADGMDAFGSAEIPVIAKEFPNGWVNGWSGPPRKHAAITLRMTALLHASGVPITFSYVENTHGRCDPGKVCRFDLQRGEFDDLLKADDEAFGRFFRDLAALGITPSNTLFVITTDEGDHYLGEGLARPVNIADLKPAITGSNALFYPQDEDRIAAELAARDGVQFMASRSAMRGLHIADGTDARTPAFMAFSDADATFRFDNRRTSFRWNHGNIDPDITNIWIGLRGPGITPGTLTGFTDHVDIVPTIRALLGIRNGPDTDGVAILTAFERSGGGGLIALREAFKQLNAPVGRFGQGLLQISTEGIRAGGESRAEADGRIDDLVEERDEWVVQARAILDGVKSADPDRIQDLLETAHELLAKVNMEE